MSTVIGVLAIVIGVLGVFVLVLGYAIVSGAIILTIMWGWFITPAFDIPVPPLPIMAGISTIINYMTYQSTPTYKDHKIENSNLTLVSSLLRPWLTLAMAWIIHVWAGNSMGLW